MTASVTRRGMLLAAGAAALAAPAGATRADAATPAARPGEIVPFQVHVPRGDIDDLNARLASARLPDQATSAGWVQGAPLARVRDLVDYWRRDYDWRRLEHRLNSLPQFRTTIDGLAFYFIH